MDFQGLNCLKFLLHTHWWHNSVRLSKNIKQAIPLYNLHELIYLMWTWAKILWGMELIEFTLLSLVLWKISFSDLRGQGLRCNWSFISFLEDLAMPKTQGYFVWTNPLPNLTEELQKEWVVWVRVFFPIFLLLIVFNSFRSDCSFFISLNWGWFSFCLFFNNLDSLC